MIGYGMANYEEFEWTVGRSYLVKGSWRDGSRFSTFRHRLGLVEVEEYLHRAPVTIMRFTKDGVVYSRRWEAAWGDKTLARLAREFIEERS